MYVCMCIHVHTLRSLSYIFIWKKKEKKRDSLKSIRCELHGGTGPYFSVKFNEPSRNGTPLKKILERHVIERTQWWWTPRMGERRRRDIKRKKKKKERRHREAFHANLCKCSVTRPQLSNVYGYMQTLQFTVLAFRYATTDNIFGAITRRRISGSPAW